MSPRRRSLTAFVVAQRKKDCPVCQLPPALLRMLEARNRKIVQLPTALAWLKECGHRITIAQYLRHGRAGHHINLFRASPHKA